MGAAGSVESLTAEQKADLFDDFVNQAKTENSDLAVNAKVANFTVEFAKEVPTLINLIVA